MSTYGLTLLLVEPDPADRAAIRRALDGADLRADLDEEGGADRVLERMAGKRYDCLLVSDRTDALNLLRSVRVSFATPILALTRLEEMGARMVAAGASDYLPMEDLTPTRLARRLRSALRMGDAEAQTKTLVAQLAAERQLLEAVLKQMPAAVMIAHAATGEILLTNDQARELLGQKHRSLAELGRLQGRMGGLPLLPEDWPIARAIACGDTVVNEELELDRDGGGRVIVRASAAPVILPGDEGRALAAVMTLDDITLERRAQEQLERAVRARDEILAIVSHDLRNPLNAVSIAVEEMTSEPMPDAATRASYAAAIKRSVQRAGRLIRDLLDASRIEAGQLAMEPRPVDAGSLLEQAAADHEVLVREAGMSLTTSLAGRPLVLADRERVRQALGNLIGNALHHARAGGVIELSAAPEAGDRVALCISDRGPGIPDDALPHVFDRYWQAGRALRAGAGLGLAIARGIAEAHGGAIAATNREGGGACFTLSLPAAT